MVPRGENAEVREVVDELSGCLHGVLVASGIEPVSHRHHD
jgi:hypothetical protein